MNKLVLIITVFSLSVNFTFASVVCEQKIVTGKYDSIYDYNYSQIDDSLVFEGERDRKWQIVQNGITSEPYEEIEHSFNAAGPDFMHVGFSKDRKSSFFIAYKNGNRIIVKDGKEFDTYDETFGLVYSPDSSEFAYVAFKNDTYYVIKNNNIIYENSSITANYIHNISLQYSPNGKSFSIQVYENEDTAFIIKDGIKIDKEKYIYGLKFSNDGGSYAYHVGNIGPKEEQKIIEVTTNGEYTYKDYSSLHSHWYQGDDERVSFVARKFPNSLIEIQNGNEPDFKKIDISVKDKDGKFLVMMNGITIGEYYEIGNFVYSQNGNSVSFKGLKGGNKWVVVKDGKESKEYEKIGFIRYSNLDYPYSTNFTDLFFTGKINNTWFLNEKGNEATYKVGEILNFEYTKNNKYKILFGANDNISVVNNGIESILLGTFRNSSYNGDVYVPGITFDSNKNNFYIITSEESSDLLYKNGENIGKYYSINDFRFINDQLYLDTTSVINNNFSQKISFNNRDYSDFDTQKKFKNLSNGVSFYIGTNYDLENSKRNDVIAREDCFNINSSYKNKIESLLAKLSDGKKTQLYKKLIDIDLNSNKIKKYTEIIRYLIYKLEKDLLINNSY